MKLFCTTKNSGPSWQSDPLHMVYLGTDFRKAKEAVGDFLKYRRYKEDRRWPTKFTDSYSVIPRQLARELIAFYSADGWWFSIVEFEIN